VKTTLIQIVSEETMPNLLAAMAIKPDRVVHLCTPAMADASAALERAYGQTWVKTSVITRNLGEHPGISDTDLNREYLKEADMAEGGLTRWETIHLAYNSFVSAFSGYDIRGENLLKAETEVMKMTEECDGN